MASFIISKRFPTISVCCSDKPVTLRPGRAKFSTNPVPSGSTATANTMGMTDVACFAAGTPAPVVTMTSTFSLTNSAAISLYNSTRPSAQRPSTAMLRPSIHESSCNRCRKGVHSEAVLVPSNPIIGSLPACCAFAASGHAAAPASPPMNSRLCGCRFGGPPPGCLRRNS
jgi:hypothetical protein